MSGAAGHIWHLYENRSLTFGELKDILSSASEGKLERASEKIDGMNLVFTFDVQTGQLRVARSGGDIKRGGMDAQQLADKFKDRGNLTEAFNEAFSVLSDASSALSSEEQLAAFGAGGDVWYSVEVVYSRNPNVVNYDRNYIVFHGAPVFEVDEDDDVARSMNDTGCEVLSRNIDKMQGALKLRSWRVMGPALVKLKNLSDGSTLSRALSSIDATMSSVGVSDSDTIEQYMRMWMRERISMLELSPELRDMVVERAISAPDAPKLTDIKRYADQQAYAVIREFVNDVAPMALKQAIAPIEGAIHTFAVEVLAGMRSCLVGNHYEEVKRLRSAVSSAIERIQSSGDEKAMDTLKRQLEKLGGVENITTPVEGVVFQWKGQTYKLTGSFAAANQILGVFRYRR